MGQRQSAEGGEENESAPLKQDYYELLGLEHDASEDDIKKAYRRKALELHPDRNYGDEEGATKLFAEVQAAYEILSDPQERAWYDSHRDILLRGDAAGPDSTEFSYNIRMTSAEEVLKLMLQFNKKVEYNDAPSGFFGGLDDFYKRLAKEEDAACQWQGLDQLEYPEFGSEHDEYEDVVRPFYAAWAGFATRKSYSWKDQYRLQDAPDRRIRRLMEKENQKLRDGAIQEFNDAVRSLTAFVRKRDPRVQNNQKSEAERQKALRDLASAQAARARAQRQKDLEHYENTTIPAWAQSNFKDEYEGGFSSESEEERHEYDCVVCDKTFRSEAQYHAHEKSKKHVKLLKELKKDMRKQGHDLGLNATNGHGKAVQEQSDPEEDHEVGAEAEAEEPPTAKSPPSRQENDHGDSSEEEQVTKATPNISDTESETDEYAPRSTVLNRLGKQDLDPTETLSNHTESITLVDDTPTASEPDTGSRPKVGKAKQKKAKKAAQQAASQQAGQDHKCAICAEVFTSKTKLFKHIMDEGHAAPISQTKAAGKTGRGKKR